MCVFHLTIFAVGELNVSKVDIGFVELFGETIQKPKDGDSIEIVKSSTENSCGASMKCYHWMENCEKWRWNGVFRYISKCSSDGN